jgi:WD40 repeat protein
VTSLPHPEASRAVLIGATTYKHLENLPAISNNLTGFRDVLIDSTFGGLPANKCTVVEEPSSGRDVYRAVRRQAQEAEDMLLVYFTGHGRIGARNELYLCLPDTHPDELAFTALAYEQLREAVADSRATKKVVILDCCFSGRALADQAGDDETITGQVGIEGSYILTATPANAVALAPPGERYTAFTGALLDLLRTGIPGGAELLTFAAIYPRLAYTLTSRRLPRPRQQGTDTIAQLALTRNPGYNPRHDANQHLAAPQRSAQADRPVGPVRQPASPSQTLRGMDTEAPRIGPTASAAPARIVRTLVGNIGTITCAAFSPDGRLIAAGGAHAIRLWGTATGQAARTVKPPRTRKVHTVSAVAFSPDGGLVAARVEASPNAKSHIVLLLDPETCQNLRTIDFSTKHGRPSLAFSPDGQLVTKSSTGGVKIWEPRSGRLLRTIEIAEKSSSSYEVGLGLGSTYPGPLLTAGVAFSPNGQMLAVAVDSTVQVWLANTDKYLCTLESEDANASIRAVQFSPDSRILAAIIMPGFSYRQLDDARRPALAVSTGGIQLWDPTTGRRLHTLKPDQPGKIWVLGFSPDGKLLGAGTSHGTVWLWNPATGEHEKTIAVNEANENAPTVAVPALTFSPDGHLLAIGVGGQLQLWS